jgi:NAD-dependent SIR2 family protein deacetylase
MFPSPVHALDPVAELVRIIENHRPLFVLTGAGCSTDSGIPDYRDHAGRWKRLPPVQYRDFVRDLSTRQRYWARSMLGWKNFSGARPNAAHAALARLEADGFVHRVVTQNVDGLHQRAGSRRVIDLHGRLDAVACLDCRARYARSEIQRSLQTLNSAFLRHTAKPLPDGDVDLDGVDFDRFVVPHCTHCRGVLKPDVVFFGESVPASRVAQVYLDVQASGAVLVIGSSLAVYSGYRFCRAAAEQGKPIAAVNLGRMRGDDLLDLKISAPCAAILEQAADRVAAAAA